jgi:hypothetical protein
MIFLHDRLPPASPSRQSGKTLHTAASRTRPSRATSVTCSLTPTCKVEAGMLRYIEARPRDYLATRPAEAAVIAQGEHRDKAEIDFRKRGYAARARRRCRSHRRRRSRPHSTPLPANRLLDGGERRTAQITVAQSTVNTFARARLPLRIPRATPCTKC